MLANIGKLTDTIHIVSDVDVHVQDGGLHEIARDMRVWCGPMALQVAKSIDANMVLGAEQDASQVSINL